MKIKGIAVAIIAGLMLVISIPSSQAATGSTSSSNCSKLANAASGIYAKATGYWGQKVANFALATALDAAKIAANALAQGRPGVAANISAQIAKIQKIKATKDIAGKTVKGLNDQKTLIASTLTDLGKVCNAGVVASKTKK
jgi:hypothetical protein